MIIIIVAKDTMLIATASNTLNINVSVHAFMNTMVVVTLTASETRGVAMLISSTNVDEVGSWNVHMQVRT